MNGTKQRDGALLFVTEQSCCLAQDGNRDKEWFKACETAAEYLTDVDAETMAWFRERVNKVAPAPDEDYGAEEYTGKDRNMAGALYALLT